MPQTKIKNRLFRLKNRPVERVVPENFSFLEEDVPELKDGEVLIRNLLLSLDPTNRIWMSDMEQYMPPVEIGEVMRGLGVGRVEESKNPGFKKGDNVSGLLGWQDYLVADGETLKMISKLPEVPGVSLQTFAGAAGMTGLTAYFGLFEIGQPKEGETLVVSAAAGAVGSVVGQLGKISGLKVVGIAGSADKCKWLVDDLGFDAAVNYKDADWKKNLEEATPDGIDINFENVGGEIMQTIHDRMNLNGRMVLCGLISGYNDKDDSKSRISLTRVLMKRLKIQGFIVMDFARKNTEAITKLATWLSQGKIKHRETIVDGLENAPTALNKLFDGSNVGKLLVRVSE